MEMYLLLYYLIHIDMHGSTDSPMRKVEDINTPIVLLHFDEVSK